jgi:hypothetical protein
VAAKVAQGNGRGGWSVRRRSAIEEGDGLLEQRSSSQRSTSGRGLGNREAVMRAHEGGARWPALGAEANAREEEWSGRELDDSCGERRERASPSDR